ncbi:hypothetical protein [Pseudomarimonas salicorniae]|uniref:Sigma-E factor negative regulatory protein RseA n=1 Tax=Pseudomarimonas salicorniae TaxID=2933270 RepID=A0ABT0GDK9_9GAMM|nr:hypothetical protein [Lysobacter sp. CAU 1642]MCK7592122.1 hypothetical protein [Lysobacter sp. CAU 1642]
MIEDRLRDAWRRHTAESAARAASTEALYGLEEGADAGRREQAVRLMAEDARAADLGRALLAIGDDARALEREFIALRRPRETISRQRVAMAMAAMLALAAVITVPQWRGETGSVAPPAQSDSLIAASSFELDSAAPQPETKSQHPAEPDLLFRGGFDS